SSRPAPAASPIAPIRSARRTGYRRGRRLRRRPCCVSNSRSGKSTTPTFLHPNPTHGQVFQNAAPRPSPHRLFPAGSLCSCLRRGTSALAPPLRPARRGQKPRRPLGPRPPRRLDQRPSHALGHLFASLRLPPSALGPRRH